MDMLEIGSYSAVIVYGLIVVWTVLVRVRWLQPTLERHLRALSRQRRIAEGKTEKRG